ncbi:hypothetical protein AOLI_G00079790 [Acnodon oligacanthus]
MGSSVLLIALLLATVAGQTIPATTPAIQENTEAFTSESITAVPAESTTAVPAESITAVPAETPTESITAFTAETPSTATFRSCAHPAQCCPEQNNSCQRNGCFCDVACLRFHDCCPDFNATCITGVAQNSTHAPSNYPTFLPGSCMAEPALCCAGFNLACFRGCFCDKACQSYNDCCPDYDSTCDGATPTARSSTFSSTGVTPTARSSTFSSTGVTPTARSSTIPQLDTSALPITVKETTKPQPSQSSPLPFSTTAPPNPETFSTASSATRSATTPPSRKDVFTVISNLEVELLAPEDSTEEERRRALYEAACRLRNYLTSTYDDIYSFEITHIEEEYSCLNSQRK